MNTGRWTTWTLAIQRYTALTTAILVLLGVAAAGYVYWTKQRAEHSLAVANQYHLASSFKSVTARSEIHHLLSHDDVSSVERLNRHYQAIYLIRNLTGDLLELQRRFADPRFADLTKRLTGAITALDDEDHGMPVDEPVSGATRQILERLSGVLVQLERLHVIAYEDVLSTHEHSWFESTVGFIAFLSVLLLLGCLCIWKGLGAIKGIVGRAREAEQALRDSERGYRTILETMTDTFYRTDARGRVVMVSPSVVELLGYEPEELRGRQLADFYVEPGGRDTFLDALRRNGGSLTAYETRLRHKDGHEVWVSSSSHFYLAQFAKRRHGLVIAASRQALGDGWSPSSMRWNHLR